MVFTDNVLVLWSNTPSDVPTPDEMTKNGRIAVNQADGKLFTRTPSGAVRSTNLNDSLIVGVLRAANNLSDLVTPATARSNLGLGSIATQAASAVAITGGAINGVPIGGTTPTTGAFTLLSATSLSGLTSPLSLAQGGTGAAGAGSARTTLGAAASGSNSDITALTGLTTPLSIAGGGTGGTTASAARANLVTAASGANSDITALSGLTTPLSLTQGGTGGASASTARLSLGLGSAATLSVGTTAGTVAAGDDARITGAWQAPTAATTYTPTVTATTGTLTTVSATGRYLRIGPRLLYVEIDITLTTNGTGSGSIMASLPATAGPGIVYTIVGRETAVTGSLLQGVINASATAVSIVNYDNSYPGANGRRLIVSGTYETN